MSRIALVDNSFSYTKKQANKNNLKKKVVVEYKSTPFALFHANTNN
jgi:hypothetical protein